MTFKESKILSNRLAYASDTDLMSLMKYNFLLHSNNGHNLKISSSYILFSYVSLRTDFYLFVNLQIFLNISSQNCTEKLF